jgi:hypothetical protein
MNLKLIGKNLSFPLAGLTALGLFLSSFGTLAAAERVYHYESINVDIKILENSDIQVSEIQTFVFTSGDFHYAYRWIPTDRLESIDSVEVWEGDRQYPLNPAVKEWIDIRKETGRSPGGDTYAYATWTEKNKFWVGWWFPETSNSRRIIELRYTVHGGLRLNSPADQLYWKAIFGDRDAYVDSSQVFVHLPGPVPPEQLLMYSYGVPATKHVIDDTTIEFITGSIPAAEELEINIYFPHGMVSGVPPAWQKKLEQREAYNDSVKPISVTYPVWFNRCTDTRGSLDRSHLQEKRSPAASQPGATVAVFAAQ